MDSTIDYFFFAAEPSADLHGYELIREIKALKPQATIAFVGGPKMRQTGKCLMKMEQFMAMGFIDVLFSLPRLIYLFFKLRAYLLKQNPKTLVFIDYPGFNLRIEKSLRKKGFKNKILHYVSPSVWAWDKKRADILAKHVDHLLIIYPFEKKYYEGKDLKVSYVGNPLAYKIDQYAHEKKEEYLAIFPGSRKKEIERNLPLQLKCLASFKHFPLAISLSHEKWRGLVEKMTKKIDVKIFPPEKSYELMAKTKLAIATSGTVNLELALMSVPTIVTFAVKPLDYFIVRKILKIDLPFYSIVNIIENEEIFPELFGPNFTENKLRYHIERYLIGKKAYQKTKNDLKLIKKHLTFGNPAKKSAEIMIDRI